MQPEYDKTLTPSISADGKCSDPPERLYSAATTDTIDHLEIIIDGTHLLGGIHPTTLLGHESRYLPESRRFHLIHLELLDDGRCLVKYRRAPFTPQP